MARLTSRTKPSRAKARTLPKVKRITTPTSNPEETRERLLRAAQDLFAEKGYDGASVKALATAAGVNVSLVSYHFGGKEGLYRACIEQFGRGRLAVAQRMLQPPTSAEDFKVRLRMYLEEIVNTHVEQPNICSILHREHQADLAITMDIFRNTFMKAFETLVAFIAAAQAKRIVRKELDPMIVSSFVFGGLLHMVQSDPIGERFFGRTIKNAAHRTKLLDHVMDVSLSGFLEGERS